jgi:hypothetical protein
MMTETLPARYGVTASVLPNKERPGMKRVTGIGGVFFKSDDPEKLYQ